VKIAILTADSREHFHDYENPAPYFGTAPEALLQGFAKMPEVEIHVVSCVRQPVNSPQKIAPNIFYHSLHVPKIGWMRTLYQGCIRATRKKLHEIQPDIVHGQGTEHNNALGAVYSWKYATPRQNGSCEAIFIWMACGTTRKFYHPAFGRNCLHHELYARGSQRFGKKNVGLAKRSG
jgi:hypothetical protein